MTAAAATGCFYTSPINERPATELVKVQPTSTPFRGDPVIVAVSTIDPDGDPVDVTWTATACNAGGTACEPMPFATGVVDPALGKLTFQIKDSVTTRSVVLVAHTEDSYGAPAVQDARLTIDVANHAPEITYQVGSVSPPGGPTIITARATDPDDDVDSLTFSGLAIVDAPFPSAGTLTKISDNSDVPDRTSADETYRLVPDVDGTWTIGVTVTDPVATATTESQPVLIGTDQPPCIVDVAPTVPSPGNTMPLDQLRRFSVLVVEDDLDVFPAPSIDDPYYGPATFTWSLASPASGGAYVEIPGAVENALELDPAAYDVNDALFLRVEIADRIPRTLPCPPGDLTCAIDPAAVPPCIQRQTWALEVR